MAGRAALALVREDGLTDVVLRPDPFDLAVSRLDSDSLQAFPAVLQARLDRLCAMRAHDRAKIEQFAENLSVTERFVVRHRDARFEAEFAWHEALLADLPRSWPTRRSAARRSADLHRCQASFCGPCVGRSGSS